MKQSTQSIKVLDIYLDSDNPRHNLLDDQQEIIKYLLGKEKVSALAKDIAKIGTSPLDLVAVMKNKSGHYIALEGNRRICALKLLNDPQQAPPGKVSLFSGFQAEAESIQDEIMAVVFRSREEADPWLDRRHMGQQNGVGIKDWNSDQRTRRNAKKKKGVKDNNALAQTLLNYACQYEILGEYPKKVLTTASRYLGNPEFRKGVGIYSARTEPEVLINVAHENFEVFLGRFCKDLLEGKKIHSRSKRPEWLSYLAELRSEGIVSDEKIEVRLLLDRSNYINATDLGPEDSRRPEKPFVPDNPAPSEHKPTSPHNPDTRKYILPAGFNVSTRNVIMRRIANEMKGIVVKEYPLAVAVITRAFLEETYRLFIEARTGEYPSNGKTHVVIGKVCEELSNETGLSREQKTSIDNLRKLANNQHSPLSPQTLGNFVHANSYPDHESLKREFDNISIIIEYILTKV